MSKKETASGRDPKKGFVRSKVAPAPIDPRTGQHGDYWVLSKEERKKKFVRPLRRVYVHTTCKIKTRMSFPIAETYARKPKFYDSTFCVGCRGHFRVDEFVWENSEEKVGS